MGIDSFWAEKTAPLIQRDHFIREALEKRGVLADAYHKEMEKVHIENAQKLKSMIEKKGFPVLSNAGDQGVRQTWLIIQHAISWPDFMRECLLEMKLAASNQDYPLELIAYTEDRIAFFEGRGQLYGTNLDWQKGDLKPTLIEDPKMLDQRRKSIGLPPLATYLANISTEKPPKDPEKKQFEFQEWLKRVGWRS